MARTSYSIPGAGSDVVDFLCLLASAWLVLGYCFLGEFLSGAASLFSSATGAGGVAFWAHVGGFRYRSTSDQTAPGTKKMLCV